MKIGIRFIFITFSLVIALLIIYQLTKRKYYNDSLEIKVISELADCEKYNLFLKVLEINDTNYNKYLGCYILPVCKNKECENLLYSIEQFDTTKVFILNGKLSKESHSVKEYGCPNAQIFAIDTIEEVDFISMDP